MVQGLHHNVYKKYCHYLDLDIKLNAPAPTKINKAKLSIPSKFRLYIFDTINPATSIPKPPVAETPNTLNEPMKSPP